MALVMLAIRLALGPQLTNAGLVAVAAAGGAVTFLVTLWIVDRALLGELLEVGRDALRGRRGQRAGPVAGPTGAGDTPPEEVPAEEA
jgi:hypothetical protein